MAISVYDDNSSDVYLILHEVERIMSPKTVGEAKTRGDLSEFSEPQNGRLILTVLILGAILAMINLSMGNVALPSIAMTFNTTGTQQNWITDGFTLAMAATVLYFGAIGDRYGRKKLFLLGAILSVPTAFLSAIAWSAEILIIGRILSGFASALLFPTTLSLITAIWPAGPGRTKSIALWAGIGGAASALGPSVGGFLVQTLSWRWIFGISIPLALISFLLGWRLLPKYNGENIDPVDHLGGILTMVFVGSLIFAINEIPQKGFSLRIISVFVLSLISLGLFIWRESRVIHPLMDLAIWKNRVFTGATIAATIVYGSLMGVMFIGQQYLQNVLSYTPLSSGLAILPASVFMIIGSQVCARTLQKIGGRIMMAISLAIVGISFVMMWLNWKEDTSYWIVGPTYALIGLGVGMASAASARAIMGSLPVTKAGISSAVNDLTRDFGGAVGMSVMGAMLAVRYTNYFTEAFASLPAYQAQNLSQQIAFTLSKSFAGAEQVAQQYSAFSTQILDVARSAFLMGQDAAYILGIVASIVAVLFIIFIYPQKADEDAVFEDVTKESIAEIAEMECKSNNNIG
jgi:DHA2 family multidrug resistance protein-like MFS transporter